MLAEFCQDLAENEESQKDSNVPVKCTCMLKYSRLADSVKLLLAEHAVTVEKGVFTWGNSDDNPVLTEFVFFRFPGFILHRTLQNIRMFLPARQSLHIVQ